MTDIPPRMLAKRREVAARFLAGDGIEIGALHHPLWTDPARARVRYVDRSTVPELRRQYPELHACDLVEVDVVDDGETLGTFPDESLDFIVGNHLLEHCENPLGTLRSHVRKIRPGGVLYYAVPDKRMSFDIDRPLTPFAHLVRDDQEGPAVSRLEHFREWAVMVIKRQTPTEVEETVRMLDDANGNIHFHVWDPASYADFLDDARRYLGEAFTVEHAEHNDCEMITVLRKRG